MVRKFKFRKSKPKVGAGSHRAFLRAYEEIKSKQFGKLQLRAEFEISCGECAGSRISMWCNLENDDGEPIEPSPMSKLGALLIGLAGRPLDEGEEFDLDSAIGKEYLLGVSVNTKGFSKIDSITAAPDEKRRAEPPTTTVPSGESGDSDDDVPF